jgi:hypothetical protein
MTTMAKKNKPLRSIFFLLPNAAEIQGQKPPHPGLPPF